MGKPMKKGLLGLAVAGLALALCIQSTLAFYVTTATVTNVVTSGEVALTIRESSAGPVQGSILPGDVISKVVTVENTCHHPLYLRVRLVCGMDAQGLPPEAWLKPNIDTAQWVFWDGWYYYAAVLYPGEETPAVFSQVQILGAGVDSSMIGKGVSVSVEAQGVQSENNPPAIAGDFTTVSGWPEKQEG